MKIVSDISLRNFQFWSGAKDTAAELTVEQLDQVEAILEDLYPDGMTDTQINDLFWFESDTIREWVGIKLYPKWGMFVSKLGNERYVQIDDIDEENKLIRQCKEHGIDLEIWENSDEPAENDFLEVSDFDYDEWMWEEDGFDFQYDLYLPKDWASVYNNTNQIGLTDKERKAYNKFLSDYSEYLNNENYKCYWDTEHVVYRDKLDYGESGDSVTLRIYQA